MNEPIVNTSAGKETASQTVARITAERAAAANKQTSQTTTPSDTLITTLTDRLSKQSQGISTSSSSNLQDAIDKAITSTQTAGDLSSQKLASEQSRESLYAQDRASSTLTSAMEGQTGYARQVTALRELTDTTEKSVRDLDQRYREAILANDSATASTVAGLQMQKLEFLQTQEQQFFQNLMSLANIQESQASRKQQESQFQQGLTHDEVMFEKQLGSDISMFEKQTAKDERNMLLSLAAENGVAVGPNDTIETMIGKISPFVNEKKALELSALRSQISANNASAAKALSGASGSELSETDIEALAMAYASGNQDVIGFIEDGATMSKILNRASAMESDRTSGLTLLAKSVTSKEELARLVSESSTINATQAEIDSMSIVYGPQWASRASTKGGQSSFGKNTNLTEEEKLRLERLRGTTISQG